MREVDPNYLVVQPVELGGLPRPRLLLKDVYCVYTGQFRSWLAITAPTSLLASGALLMADRKITAIFRSFLISEIPYHRLELAEAGALRYGSFFVSWFLGCFALAAIATVVNRLDVNNGTEVWRRDSYQGLGNTLERSCWQPSLHSAHSWQAWQRSSSSSPR
jgi:hypothetical protein